MLKRITQSPYLNLLSGLILLITSGYEVIAHIDDAALGIHHGIMLFSLIQIAKVIPEIMHGLTEIEEADETMAPECCPMCPNLADGTLAAHVTLPSTARSN